MGSPGPGFCGSHIVSKRLWEKKKTVPPPPPELQSCPPGRLRTVYGLICVLPTPAPSSLKWSQMNETNAQSQEPQPHSHTAAPLPGNTNEGCPGAGRAGAELEPRPRSPSTFPLPARRPTRGFSARSPPRPPPAAAHPLSAGAPDAPCRRHRLPGGDQPGDGARCRSHPRTEAARKFARGLAVCAAAPLGKPLSGSPRRRRPRGRSRRRCSTGRARRPRTAPCAPRAGSPRPLGQRRGAALAVYRGPAAARSPRPPPCALLTSFILSHPRPPTPFPNSDSPAARWRQRSLPPL